MTIDKIHDRCDNCGQVFRDGEGISGYNEDNYRKDYDFDCAIKLGIEVDAGGMLVAA